MVELGLGFRKKIREGLVGLLKDLQADFGGVSVNNSTISGPVDQFRCIFQRGEDPLNKEMLHVRYLEYLHIIRM